MIYCFDLDGTLCTSDVEDYSWAEPLWERIDRVNGLFDEGHVVKIYTARGMTSGVDYQEITEWQLGNWGVKHHELIMGKPAADLYIDDKAVNAEEFFNG